MGKVKFTDNTGLVRNAFVAVVLSCITPWVSAATTPTKYSGLQQLKEVVVTAQLRAQPLEDVPVSLTAVTQNSIAQQGLYGFRQWADYVPGLTMFEGEDANRRTGPSATIRGVGHIGQGQLYESSSSLTTSYAIGQVPFFNADPFTYDLNRIEVLRGPQGTLFGISAMGGVIRFIPNYAKTDKFEADIGGGAGLITHGSTLFEGHFMVNVPIIANVLAVRIAAQERHNNGYIDVYEPGLDQTCQCQQPVTNTSAALSTFDTRNAPNMNVIQDANKSSTAGLRFSLTYTPNARFTLRATTTWQKSDTAQVPWVNFNDVRPWVLTQFTLTPQGTRYVLQSIDSSYDMGFGTLHFIGGYYNEHFYENYPITEQARNFLSSPGVDSINLDGGSPLPADPYPTRTDFPFATQSRIRTGELRLQGENKPLGITGPFGDELTFNYILGGFYEYERRYGTWEVASPNWNANRGPNTAPILTSGGLIIGAVGGSTYHQRAGFLHLTLNLSHKLSIAGGARYYVESLSIGQCNHGDLESGKYTAGATVGDNLNNCAHPGLFQERSETGLTPSATATYHIDKNKMIYFRAAEGKRMGQGNANPAWPNNTTLPSAYASECEKVAQSLGILSAIRNGTKSDSVWSKELGLKAYWMDRKLLTNIAVYQENWNNYQQTVLMVQYDPNCGQIVVANLGGALIRGFELESTYLATDHITLNTAISNTDAKFVNIPPGVGSSLAGVDLHNGDSLRDVAPWTAVVGAEYHRELPQIYGHSVTGYIRADWRYVGERMNNFGNEKLLRANPVRKFYFMKPYNLLDIRMGAESGGWSYQFYVSNVLDREVMFDSAIDLREPALQTGGTNQPRTIGFTVDKRF